MVFLQFRENSVVFEKISLISMQLPCLDFLATITRLSTPPTIKHTCLPHIHTFHTPLPATYTCLLPCLSLLFLVTLHRPAHPLGSWLSTDPFTTYCCSSHIFIYD